MLHIALDAMGSDRAPRPEIEGALSAARELGVEILLVGPPHRLQPALRDAGWTNEPIAILPASDVVTMDDAAVDAVRAKRDSSVRIGIEALKQGTAVGFVSAGNTGAVVAAATLRLGTLPSVIRPALATVLPTLSGRGTLLLDIGANADCRPVMLDQFAVMGAAYAARVMGVARPQVGLLSIGEESGKGNALTREAHGLLRRHAPHRMFDFIGNVEGKDLYAGVADVVVCDGFTGNVVLKTSEGLAAALLALLGRVWDEVTPPPNAATLAELRRVRAKFDYAEYGGALLLGVPHPIVIAHGRSTGRAIYNAIRAARDAFLNNVSHQIAANATAAVVQTAHYNGATHNGRT
ncbi:MAG: phosphate acyltransferase PlsX [Chloracidobacterium sp.]|nr:phosphate acyltransferase PlsX [Chloracidobacterium sp.]MDW8216113.1 phosphate acyltransferase PlsX [Acidobacteriota bacterium]